MRLLFKNARVMQSSASGGLTTKRMAVGVQDDHILFAGPPPSDFYPERTVDCREGLLMPGFVNAHTHSALCLLRGQGENLCLTDWLSHAVWPFEAKHTYDSCYWGTVLNAAENIRYGTTCLNDMYIFPDATAAALSSCGMRALVSGTVTDELMGLGTDCLEQIARLASQYKDDPLIRIGVAPHAVYTCSNTLLRRVASLCKELVLPVHIHVSETAGEVEQCVRQQGGLTPPQLLDRLGLLHPHVLLAHCTHLTAEDVQLIAERGACAVHCPRSNLKLGSGIASVFRLLEAGALVAVGTDSSASSNNQDMLEELRFAALLQKGVERDPTALSMEQCVFMSTRSALSAMGFTNQCGITPGAIADLVLVDRSEVTWLPDSDPLPGLLFAAHGGDVRLTMTAGRILYEDGEYKTIDMDRLHWEVARQMKRLNQSDGSAETTAFFRSKSTETGFDSLPQCWTRFHDAAGPRTEADGA